MGILMEFAGGLGLGAIKFAVHPCGGEQGVIGFVGVNAGI